MIYKHVKYGTTCPKGLAAPGSRWCLKCPRNFGEKQKIYIKLYPKKGPRYVKYAKCASWMPIWLGVIIQMIFYGKSYENF